MSGSTTNCPRACWTTAAATAMRAVRVQDFGRPNPMAVQLPSRNRKEINPIAKRSGTEFGNTCQTLYPKMIRLPVMASPADMQAQYMTLATQCEGASVVVENIFENRFMHAQELVRMGANIKIEGRRRSEER